MNDAPHKEKATQSTCFVEFSKRKEGIVGKRQPPHDPRLEAALDELDAALTADVMGEILRDLPETDEVVSANPELPPPVYRPGSRVRRKR